MCLAKSGKLATRANGKTLRRQARARAAHRAQLATGSGASGEEQRHKRTATTIRP
jgi:hypothetical protein